MQSLNLQVQFHKFMVSNIWLHLHHIQRGRYLLSLLAHALKVQMSPTLPNVIILYEINVPAWCIELPGHAISHC